MKSSPHRRLLRAATALAAAVVLLAGCGTAQQTPGGTNPDGKVAGEITFGTFWAYVDQSVIDDFQKLYPDVKVNLEFTASSGYQTKLQSQAAANDLPDVFAGNPPTLAALAKANRLYDLTNALAGKPQSGDFASWGESFEPALLDYPNSQIAANLGREGNLRLAVPLNALSIATVYNTKIFTEVGIKVPTSFEELLSNCRALNAAGYIPMSLAGASWGGWWMQLAWDQTMQNDKAADFTPTSKNFLRAFEIVEQMVTAGCWDKSQVTTDIAAETSLFLQGKTAQFTTVPENFLQTVVKDAKFELGSYVIPPLAGVDPNRTLGGGTNGLAIAKDTDNAAAAIAFVKYLTSPPAQKKFAEKVYTLPSIKIDVSSSNPLMKAYLDSASNGFAVRAKYLPLFTTAGTTKFNTEILPKFYLGQITPQEAATQAAGLVQK